MTKFVKRKPEESAEAIELDGKTDDDIIAFKNATTASTMRVLRDAETGELVILHDETGSWFYPRPGDVLGVLNTDRFENVPKVMSKEEWDRDFQPAGANPTPIEPESD